jgi:putative peptide zinc metalloprotease protein
VVVPQSRVDRVRGDAREVSLRLAEARDRVLPAALVRQVPGAHRELPSLALSAEGGGPFALDPAAPRTLTSFAPLFQFEVLVGDLPANRLGERVYVRFAHTPEPLGYRLLRGARRVFLETLSV